MDKFVLISLNDNKSKDLGNLMSNDTARRILDYLSEKEKVSPVELSKKLNIPISTITYTLKNLEKEGLITVTDQVWSEKGKKVSLYSVAQKMILIVPKNMDWKESLKKILPVFLVGILVTVGLKIFGTVNTVRSATSFDDATITESYPILMNSLESTNEAIQPTLTASNHYWVYALIITIIITLIMFIIEMRRKK